MKFGVLTTFLLLPTLHKTIGYHDDSYPEDINSSDWMNEIEYYDDLKYKEDLLKSLAEIEELYNAGSLEHNDEDANHFTDLEQLFSSEDDSPLNDSQNDEKNPTDQQDLSLLLNKLVEKTTKEMIPKQQSSLDLDEDKRSSSDILSLFKRLNVNHGEFHKEVRSPFPDIFKRISNSRALQRRSPLSLFKRYGSRIPFLFKRDE